MAASPNLAPSPVHRGHRAAIPRREALTLQAVLNHPWLVHDHMEQLAETEFRHADARKLKDALIDVLAHHSGEVAFDAAPENGLERAELVAALDRRGFAELITRIERTITTPSVFSGYPRGRCLRLSRCRTGPVKAWRPCTRGSTTIRTAASTCGSGI